jgi:uridine phosphorylase
MNELDAVQNVNFLTREKLQNSKSIIIIGIRETNTIQADLSPGEMFLTSDVIGLDNLMNFYSGTQAINDTELKQAFENQIKLAMENIKPYCLKASENLKSIFVKHFIEGITVTAPGFYGPQGRVLRIPLSTNKFMEQLKLFRYEGLRILNVDMDTSAYYAFGALMGHEVITINTVVQNTSNFENDNEVNSVIGKAVDIVLQEVLSL